MFLWYQLNAKWYKSKLTLLSTNQYKYIVYWIFSPMFSVFKPESLLWTITDKKSNRLLAALWWNHNTSASVAPSEQAAIFAQAPSERTGQMWRAALCQWSHKLSNDPWFLRSVFSSDFVHISIIPALYSVLTFLLLKMFLHVVACSIQQAHSESQLSKTHLNVCSPNARKTSCSLGGEKTYLCENYNCKSSATLTAFGCYMKLITF